MAGDRDPESLADVFWAVARRLRSDSRDSLAPYDLSPSHTRAMRVLMRHGELRLSALAEHLRIAARSTTEVVDALESRGLAARSPDPTDRRATLVHVTDEGRRTMLAIRSALQAGATELFDRLEPADRAELERILRLVLD